MTEMEAKAMLCSMQSRINQMKTDLHSHIQENGSSRELKSRANVVLMGERRRDEFGAARSLLVALMVAGMALLIIGAL
jgi:hypothetical protein